MRKWIIRAGIAASAVCCARLLWLQAPPESFFGALLIGFIPYWLLGQGQVSPTVTKVHRYLTGTKEEDA